MKKTVGLLLTAIFLGLSAFICITPFFRVASADTEYRLKLADESTDNIVFTGEWKTVTRVGWIDGVYYQSSESGASASFTFTSDKLILMGGAGNKNGATLMITVDDGESETVKISNTDSGNVFEKALAYGEHTVMFTLSLEKNQNFRFDGFYYVAPSIGTGVTEVLYNDDAIIYTSMAPGQNFYFVDDKTGGKVSYTFDSSNIRSLEIMADKNADSARIEVFIDGKSVGESDLKGTGQQNVSVYTVPLEELFPLSAGKKTKLEIKAKYVNGNSYFVFRGLKLNKYFNEDDWDKDNYVLNENLPDESLVMVEKDGNSQNITTNFTVAGGIISNNSKGNTLTYSFKGSAFEIRADKIPDGGKFAVEFDGGAADKINLYSAEHKENVVVYRVTDLELYGTEENIHTVKLTMLDEKSWYSSDNNVIIRGFNVYKRADTDENYVDPDQFDLTINPDYTLPDDMEYRDVPQENYSVSGFAFNGETYFSDSIGGSLSVNFRGTGIELYGSLGPDKGKADVYIDGELVGRINLYDPYRKEGSLLYRGTNFSQSNHDIRIEIVKEKSAASLGRYIEIGSAKAICKVGDVDKSAKIDSNNFLVRNEGFGNDVNSGYYGGTALFSNNMSKNTYIRFSFRGTSIKIYGTKANDSGVATVIVDGKTYTYNARSEKVRIVSTMVFELTDLEAGVNHELLLRIDSENNPVGSKAYIVLDYFDVENYEEIVFDGYKKIDEEHKDIGRTPALQWREAEDKEFIFQTASVGCRGTFTGMTDIVGMALLAGISVIGIKFNKRNDWRKK